MHLTLMHRLEQSQGLALRDGIAAWELLQLRYNRGELSHSLLKREVGYLLARAARSSDPKVWLQLIPFLLRELVQTGNGFRSVTRKGRL
jgi:hypothetical protein